MRGWVVLLATFIIGSFVVSLVGQQQTDQKRPAFEVATIKRNTSLDGRGDMRNEPGGRFEAVNAPVFWLVAT